MGGFKGGWEGWIEEWKEGKGEVRRSGGRGELNDMLIDCDGRLPRGSRFFMMPYIEFIDFGIHLRVKKTVWNWRGRLSRDVLVIHMRFAFCE